MEATIHPTSIVDPSCELGTGVEIGPYCVIGPDVSIDEGTKLISNVTILSSTKIGKRCTIYPYAALGGPPQEYKVDMSKAALVIGDDCVLRENITIHLGSKGKDQPTKIGNRVFIMAHSHVGHDCVLEDDVTIVTGVGLAGHGHIQKGAIISGMAGVHQHCRVGEYAFVGAGCKVTRDVLPYSLVKGERAVTVGLNAVGLKRQGWSEKKIAKLMNAMTQYFQTGKEPAIDNSEEVRKIVDFINAPSKRGICKLKEMPKATVEGSKI